MGRIEAGQWPPLHPRRNQQEQQHSARPEIQSSLAIFLSTERFHTGQEGLLKAIRGELGQTTRFIPERNFPSNQTITVGIASNNDIKIGRMQELVTAHNLDVIRVPEAEELHTKDIILDATSKAVDAARLIQESEQEIRRSVRSRPHVTMATDQLNAVPTVIENQFTHLPEIQFQRIGKPVNEATPTLASIQKTFQDLTDLANKYNWTSIPYMIELATVIHNPKDPQNPAVSVQKSVVFLSREGVESLAGERFNEYVERVNTDFNIMALAGGLELKVLEDMGIVQFITGTTDELRSDAFPPQRPEARDHAYRLALGHADEHLVKDYFTAPKTN